MSASPARVGGYGAEVRRGVAFARKPAAARPRCGQHRARVALKEPRLCDAARRFTPTDQRTRHPAAMHPSEWSVLRTMAARARARRVLRLLFSSCIFGDPLSGTFDEHVHGAFARHVAR